MEVELPPASKQKLEEWKAKALRYGTAAARLAHFQRRVSSEEMRSDLQRHARLDARRAAHYANLYLLRGGGGPQKLSKTRRKQSRQNLMGVVAGIGLYPLREISVDSKGTLGRSPVWFEPPRPSPAPPLPSTAAVSTTFERSPNREEVFAGWGQIRAGLKVLIGQAKLHGDLPG